MVLHEIIIRLILAALVSGIIGFDREFKNRPAGIRTHILVCLGATVIAMVQTQISIHALDTAMAHPELSGVLRSDQARLIAQVVSGIGFLGAGTIVVTKRSVSGLTTAASLWAVAGLGIAIGMGYYEIAIAGFIAILVVLTFLKKIINIPTLKKLEVKYVHRVETKEFLTQYFEDSHVEVRDVNFSVDLHADFRIYTNIYTVELPKGLSYTDIIEDISKNKNVTKIRLITL
ncbi:putative Mg2+ transporter-C (MgtC) family protein [Isobaculum melis]|uniref:Putative Mg2+ transporter-C (MgtC) family protein n=2 Tax=Isobaculum melis TaxID=142588 RepID=A0A1H9U9Z1_9LACT|nr:putative Mg2+ transporter-C (MgtC) family protein [Isobaculum melis]